MIVIGIDSGLTGGIAFLRTGAAAPTVFDLPTFEVKVGEKLRRKLDALELARLVRREVPADAGAVVYLEQLHARAEQGGSTKRNGMQSQGAMMECFGAVCATLQILRLPVVPVYPQSWKRIYDLGSDKTAARAMGATLYPSLSADLKRVRDDGRADAVLIAHFGTTKEF